MPAEDIQRASICLSILDHSPIGHFVLRSDFTVIFWNRCMEGWTGISREQILGRCLTDRFPHLEAPRYRQRILSMFAGGPPTIFSSQLHRHLVPAPLPGGKLRSQYSVVTSLPAPDGNGLYALFSIQDVTSLTEAIENHNIALRQAMAEMEVRKRTEAELLTTARELKRLNRMLKERSIRDGLTGLFNHRHFYQCLNRDFKLSVRHSSNLACILIDLDHFKTINDTFGHPFGDTVLRGIARLLRSKVRETDIISRYGGEEFALLLPATDLSGAVLVAEELRSKIEQHVFGTGSRRAKVTASFGIACLAEHSPSLPRELISFADRALYHAKATGRNKTVIFSHEMDYAAAFPGHAHERHA